MEPRFQDIYDHCVREIARKPIKTIPELEAFAETITRKKDFQEFRKSNVFQNLVQLVQQINLRPGQNVGPLQQNVPNVAPNFPNVVQNLPHQNGPFSIKVTFNCNSNSIISRVKELIVQIETIARGINLNGPNCGFNRVFATIFEHLRTYILQQRLSIKKLFTNKSGFDLMDGITDQSTESQKLNSILRGGKFYPFLDSVLQFEISLADQSRMSGEEMENFLTRNWDGTLQTLRFLEPQYQTLQNAIVIDEIESKLEEEKVINFLKYFAIESLRKATPADISQRLNIFRFPYISNETVSNLIPQISRRSMGSEGFIKKMAEELKGFIDPFLSRPKGVLIYGPPRTGKTFSSELVIKYLKLFLIFDPLTAGDFTNELVGQTEKMINKITERCEVIPWQLCLLFIDEIEAVAPNRKLMDSSSHKLDSMSVFLTVIDGNKKKPNLLMWGTTNLLKNLDDAFIQRFDIKIFLGNPNTTTRKCWIDNIRQMTTHRDHPNVRSFITNQALCRTFLNMTLNFSADAVKKARDKLLRELVYHENQALAEQKIHGLILDSIGSICRDDKIFLGNFILPELIRNNIDYTGDPMFRNAERLRLITRNTQIQNFLAGNMILVDFLEEASADKIQLILVNPLLRDEGINNIINSTLLPFRAAILNEDPHAARNLWADYQGIAQQLVFPEDITEELCHQIGGNLGKTIPTFEAILPLEERLSKLIMRPFQISSLGPPNLPMRAKKEDIIRFFIWVAICKECEYFYLIDSAFFWHRSAMNDEKRAYELATLLEERKEYKKGFVVFDLDDIVDMTKMYNNLESELVIAHESAMKMSSKNPTFSYKMTFPRTYEIVMECIRSEASRTAPSDTSIEHWIVILSGNNQLTKDAKEQAKWPATVSEEVKTERIREDTEVSHTCARCLQSYVEKDNTDVSCGRHPPGATYYFENDNSSQGGKRERVRLTEGQVIERIQMGRSSANDIKWSCCGKSLWEKGEIQSKHLRLYPNCLVFQLYPDLLQ